MSQAPRIIIGLDYGTSSLKAVVRRHGERFASVVALEDTPTGVPWFAAPSVIGVSQDHYYLGSAALRRFENSVERSLKVRLLPGLGGIQDEHLDLKIALQMAWALQIVQQRLDDRFGPGEYRPFLNVGAPMTQVEDPELKSRYLRILAAAWEATFGEDRVPVPSICRKTDVEPAFLRWLRHTDPVKGLGQRSYEVLPETIAPLVSMREDPSVEAGLYCVIDVGAGTTEVSTTLMKSSSDGESGFLCYCDTSEPRGGDDFDRADSGAADGATLTALAGDFRKQFWKTWDLARRKDAALPRLREKWKMTQVVLTGGAGRRPEVREAIQQSKSDPNAPWNQAFSSKEPILRERWYRPSQEALRLPNDHTGQANSREAFHLLAVAHGLSTHRREWPSWYAPCEIEPLGGPERVEMPSPTWYQER